MPRDRPKDGVIVAADDSEMWTGDVVTGGANGYFVRSYVSEFVIAMDAGRPAPEASGDGYDAAFRAYTNVVNPAPPIRPPSPGTLRGPIGTDRRFFTVPD